VKQLRQTRLLAVLVMLALVATAIGQARMRESRAASVIARENLRDCRGQLAELHRWRAGAGAADESAGVAPDTSELSRLLRTAAADAGAGQKLVSIEPGRADGSSVTAGAPQLPVFLRLEGVSLRELTTFLHRLATIDVSSRAQSIELSAAAGSEATGTQAAPELWNADVTISYANFAAGERQP
jgi:hypothetical protein